MVRTAREPPTVSRGLPRVLGFELSVRQPEPVERALRALGFTGEARAVELGPDFARLIGSERAVVERREFRLGDALVALNRFVQPDAPPVPRDIAANDVAFQHLAVVVDDVDRALDDALARSELTQASEAPQTIPLDNPSAGGVRVVYLQDPDGHFLELLAFPEHDRRATPGGVSGRRVDHSAIVTTDTERSLQYYRDRLGFTVEGRSLNRGREQEALSGVDGATVRVTSLRGAGGPGIELLEYLRRSRGESSPRAPRVTDSLHWETVVEVERLERLDDLPAFGSSPARPSDTTSLPLGYSRARISRDPDGHAVRLVETTAARESGAT